MGPSRQTHIDEVHRQALSRFGTLQTETGRRRRGALASTKKTDLGPSRQTHIDVVHRQAHNRFGTLQTDTGKRDAVASTKNRFGTLKADTDRRGAVASTKKQIWDPPGRHKHGAAASKEIDLGPSRQTGCIREHKRKFGTLQADTQT